MGLIGVSDYNDVRAALDATLDAVSLPDSVISSPIYQGIAEMQIVARVPTAATLTGVEAIQVRVATILLTASLIAPAVPMLTREQDKDYSYQRQAIDWTEVASRLQSRVDSILGSLAGDAPTVEGGVSFMFGRASGCRGAF